MENSQAVASLLQILAQYSDKCQTESLESSSQGQIQQPTLQVQEEDRDEDYEPPMDVEPIPSDSINRLPKIPPHDPHLFSLVPQTTISSAFSPPPTIHQPASQPANPSTYLSHLQRLQEITAAAQSAPKQPASDYYASTRAPSPDRQPAYSIIDWPTGLRHVKKVAARNPEALATHVRAMVAETAENVDSWFRGRARLSAARGDVRVYDEKVYKAQLQMMRAHEERLRGLGIPFMGVAARFVRLDHEEKWMGDGKISRLELLELQRKMIEYLQDLYG